MKVKDHEFSPCYMALVRVIEMTKFMSCRTISLYGKIYKTKRSTATSLRLTSGIISTLEGNEIKVDS